MRAQTIGELAAEWVEADAQDGWVLAAVTGARYIRDGRGEIFWILPARAPAHRRAILVPTLLPQWARGAAIHIEDGVLAVGAGESIDTRGACVWRAPALPAVAVPRQRAGAAILAAFALHARRAEPRGIARLLGSRIGVPRGSACAGSDVLTDVAGPIVRRILAGGEPRSTPQLLDMLQQLVGLGEGLTPSGDDFVGGILFALRSLDTAADVGVHDWHSVEDWVNRARIRTNVISACMLADLVRGHGAEPLHEVLASGFSGGNAAVIAPHIARLVQIGHTTGWDLLAGAIAGIELARRDLPDR